LPAFAFFTCLVVESVISQETIEAALRRVQSGELSPAQATRLLLAVEHDQRGTLDDERESLASLVGRLGTPPADILDAWCRQLCRVAGQYEEETGEPLPEIDPHQWSITAGGDFVCNGRPFDSTRVMATASQSSLDRINRFLDAFRPDASTEGRPRDLAGDDDGNRGVVKPDIAKDVPASDPSQRDPTAEVDQAGGNRLRRRIGLAAFFIAFVGCVAIAGRVLLIASQGEHAETPSTANNAAPGTLDGPTNAAPPVSRSAETVETAASLETLHSITEDELQSIETGAELEPSFSLQDLMPPVAHFVPPDAMTVADAESVEMDAADPGLAPDQAPMPRPGGPRAAVIPSASHDGMASDELAPDESPQRTTASMVMAAELGPVKQTDAATQLSASSLTGLELEFPFDVPLKMAEDDSGWNIHDERAGAIIAKVTSGTDGTELRWSDQAIGSSTASALTHGRITDASGGMIFLRPRIEADPWRIRVDEPDLMPTWNLRFPIPPRAARLSVAFDLPEGIEQAWVEPIAAESLRRTRGLAVLRPRDDENVALGMRLDVRCGRKLSCRIRYAGRLDSTTPWQIVTAARLAQFADQLTHQAALVSKEATRLAKVYELAGSEGKRILRVKRDRNDAQAETLRTGLRRVAQLQTLIAALEAEGSLRIRVWVDWPDTQQDLLILRADDREP
jgi:hypothetical protein